MPIAAHARPAEPESGTVSVPVLELTVWNVAGTMIEEAQNTRLTRRFLEEIMY